MQQCVLRIEESLSLRRWGSGGVMGGVLSPNSQDGFPKNRTGATTGALEAVFFSFQKPNIFSSPNFFAPFGRDFSQIWPILMQFYGIFLHYSPPQAIFFSILYSINELPFDFQALF